MFFIDSALSWCVKSYQGRLSFFYNLIGFFNQAFKPDWLMRLSKTFSLAGKKMRFGVKSGVIPNLSN